MLQIPVIGTLIQKNIMARTSRTLGTLVASGVPILESLTITRETSNNAVFERMFGKVAEAIRDGESLAKPMKEHSACGFHPVAMFFWIAMASAPFFLIPVIKDSKEMWEMTLICAGAGAAIFGLIYMLRFNLRIVDDLVVNMVDVGEETGELDTMLYKVADYYDEEVRTATDGLMKLIEPALIVFLGVAVGFIVVSLFMPLVELITSLSG